MGLCWSPFGILACGLEAALSGRLKINQILSATAPSLTDSRCFSPWGNTEHMALLTPWVKGYLSLEVTCFWPGRENNLGSQRKNIMLCSTRDDFKHSELLSCGYRRKSQCSSLLGVGGAWKLEADLKVDHLPPHVHLWHLKFES